MKRVSWLLLVLPAVAACGGAVAKDSAQKGSAGTTATATPDSTLTPEPDATEVIDDVDHVGSKYPPLPPGSSGFFWHDRLGGRDRLGNWFVTSSEGNTRDAQVSETADSQGNETGKAYYVSGDGQGEGVDLWAQLDHAGGVPVDLSAYSGISFRIRLVGATATLALAVGASGQYFPLEASSPNVVVPTSGDWQTITLPFSRMAPFNSAAVTSIDFIVTSGGAPFTVWVDDLALVCSGKCP